MHRFAVMFFLVAICSTGLWAEGGAPAAPQTARQALLEMFFSKQPGTFLKHLPAATRTVLTQSGALTSMQQYSLLAGQLQTQDKSLQTFESGPLLLAAVVPKTGQKIEVVVDNDSLRGDQDDIELSFRTYKDSQAQRTPFMPHVVFSMKIESGLWTLQDIAVTINLPLADPDFLKRISDGMKAPLAVASSQIHAPGVGQVAGQGPTITLGNDAGTLSSVRKILAAEATYAATYPAVGYTCTLSDLDGFGAAEANEHQAMLISSRLASGKHLGYIFTLANCTGTPASSFQLTAAPVGESNGRHTFCSNQSGAIRASGDGSAATCERNGTSVQ
jgi:hypothetical protein